MKFRNILVLLLLTGVSWLGCENVEPEIKTISDEDSQLYAEERTQSVSVETPEDLDVSLWATSELLGDPIAIHMDDRGKAWVTVTTRSNNSEFDIRGVDSSWLLETIKMQTVEDRRDFLHSVLAPEKSDENTWIPDRNEDGSHDWRDLTVMKEEVWQLEDETGNGMANRSQLYIRDFHDEVTDVAGAVLHHNDEVFIGAGPDMWRTRDTNNDGMSDWKESISHGYNVHIGFSGHGMSGLTIGPDGRVYWGIGDMGFSVTDKDGNEWHYPNQGAILRSDPDGSNFEVFAAGVRNTHEFTFDKYGNLITVDNDGDHSGEFERLVYLVNGSDSGWRINWQFGKYTDPKNNDYKVWMDEEYFKPRWDGQAAHVLPPLAEFPAGPAGMSYNPGTALNENWKDHFFVMSFRGSTANSPIYAFTLKEKGASFELDTQQEALKGILAVGLDFGPDGALYMTDWIDGWGRNGEGRIWKLDAPEDENSSIREETKNLLAENFNDHSAENLVELLAHEDMRVRQKAQFELAKRGDSESLLLAVTESEHQLARIHGIWGLAQMGRNDIDVVDPLQDFLDDSDPEIRAQAAKWLGDVRYESAAESIVPLLGDEHPRVRFFAAEALGRMGYSNAFDQVVEMLEQNDDEDIYLRHAGAIALARFNNGESLTALADHSSRAVRIAAVIALKRLEHPGAARFLQDNDEYIVTNAARAISDDFFAEEAIPELARMLDQNLFQNEPLVRRAINANIYSGTAADAERLVSFSIDQDHEETMRVEALDALKHWEEPSIFDRITGRYRGQIQNNADDARNALGPVVDQLLEDENPDLVIAAIEASAELNYREAIPGIYAVLQDARSAGAGIAALRGLRDLGYENIDEAIQIALSDEEEEVRMNAILMITDLDLPDETQADFLAAAFEGESVAEKQAVLKAFESLDNEPGYRFLNQQFDRLLEGDLPDEVHLELVETIESLSSEQLQTRLKDYFDAKPSDDPVVLYSESLRGGSAGSGRRIFYQNAAAQCIRCHAVGGNGSDVGPELTSIGNTLSRELLLESMVDPTGRLAPGYGVVTVTLQNGETLRGQLEEESETSLTISSGEERWNVSKSDVETRTNTPSAMPAMGDMLSRRELRDLVEFMTTLDGAD
ncbi:MAG: HEAT repeat domain-containing protein [Balneolaceae bacterium]